MAQLSPPRTDPPARLWWGPTRLVVCPICAGPARVGYLAGVPTAYACPTHGPIVPPPAPAPAAARDFDTPPAA